MKITKQEGSYPCYLIDDRWYSPTNNEFLNNRMLDRVRAAVSYQYAKPVNSIDDRLMDYLQPSFVVIDVGATTGEYSLGTSLRTRHVHAIEASPVKCNCLAKNMRLHNRDNVDHYNYAVSNVGGELEVYDEDNRIFGGSVLTDGKADSVHTVPAVTLDQFVEQNAITADWLKVTVNGFEPEVLEGAEKLLSQLQYVLIQSACYERIMRFLQERGYVIEEELVSCQHDLLNKITKIILFKNLRFQRR